MKQYLVWVAFATFFIEINAEKFSCEGRASGYYADVNAGCQVYHMCDGLGRQFSYSCPNTTLFQQRMLICDHWYMVNCSKSEVDYKANLLIGQRDKPFVEDSSEHPYHRTPRPDLLQQPYAPRYQDEEYRQGRAQGLPSSLNLVGVATDDDAEDELGNRRKNFTTDRPQYFLPSHWSTQYGKYVTTPIPPSKPLKPNNQALSGNGKASVVPEKKFSTPDFKDFKDVKNRDVLPRKQTPANFNNQKFLKVPQKVVQPPTTSGIQFINPRIDNIPDSVNQESVSPSTLALPPFVPLVRNTKPPLNPTPTAFSRPSSTGNVDNSKIPKPSIYYQPPKLEALPLVESSTMDPVSFYKLIPSKDLLPPPLLPQLPQLVAASNTPQTPLVGVVENNKKEQQPKQQSQQQSQQQQQQPQQKQQQSQQQQPKEQQQQQQPREVIIQGADNSEKRWKELRQMFFIPEYDFPLETGSRPSYESGLSSFQVNVAPSIPEAFRRPPSAPTAPSGPSAQGGSRGINPECPKCDPAFLAPGTCKPCVMIR